MRGSHVGGQERFQRDVYEEIWRSLEREFREMCMKEKFGESSHLE